MPVKKLSQRIGLSKRVRFEVFKRDKFTCQYCGSKAPEIILHVDHIEPVARGGGNEVINLITSCQQCNAGKSDKKLSDNSVIEKQRKQLELAQERREQMGLMVKWKKSLLKIDDDKLKLVKDYIETKIKPLSVNENGKNIIRDLLRRYDLDDILETVNIAATSYLRFSSDSQPTNESAENFFNKLGGILFNRRLKPIDQKIAQIKNKAKNSLSYYNQRSGAIQLAEYVAALRKYWNYTDEQIIQDLESELAPKLDQKRNWTEWQEQIEAWIASIKEKKETQMSVPSPQIEDQPTENLGAYVTGSMHELMSGIDVLSYLLAPYPNFNKEKFKTALYGMLIRFVQSQEDLPEDEIKKMDSDEYEKAGYADAFISDQSLTHFQCYDYEGMLNQVDQNKEEGERLNLLMSLERLIIKTLNELFVEHFFISPSAYSPSNLSNMREMILLKLWELKNTEKD